MKLVILLAFSMLVVACLRKNESITENNDYVLVEFAAKLEEEQDKFQALQGEKPTAP